MTLMTWPAPSELEPYPWSGVDCPRCGERELASARGFAATDFVCMACGLLTQICAGCRNEGYVCEEHPGHAWEDGDGCCGAPGMPCPACCDPIPMDGTHYIGMAFVPRHLIGIPDRRYIG